MKPILLIDKKGEREGQLYPISPKEKLFSEAWLQEVLISNPSLLSVEEIDANLSGLIPIGREVSVTAGSIDNLYITPEGLICIVETKLWRNPEAHRTVVAQVIDYAKDLSGMSFDEFKEIVERSQLCAKRPDFWQRISKHAKDIDQIELQSNIQQSLDQGRILLLIVGDKIYPEVAMLVETIQSAPNLEFKIGLFEIQAYKTSKEKVYPLAVTSRVVGKTNEVIRSVVRIIYEEKRPDVDVTVEEEGKLPKSKTNEKTFIKSMPKDFIDIFKPIFEGWVSDGFIISWGVTGFSIRISVQNKIVSIVDIYPTYISLLTEDMMKRRKLPVEPYHNYRGDIDKIPVARRHLSQNRRYVWYKDMALEEFKLFIEATDRVVRSFKKNES